MLFRKRCTSVNICRFVLGEKLGSHRSSTSATQMSCPKPQRGFVKEAMAHLGIKGLTPRFLSFATLAKTNRLSRNPMLACNRNLSNLLQSRTSWRGQDIVLAKPEVQSQVSGDEFGGCWEKIYLPLSLSQSGMLLTAFLQIGGGGGVLVEMAVVVIIDNGCPGRKESEVVGPVISGWTSLVPGVRGFLLRHQEMAKGNGNFLRDSAGEFSVLKDGPHKDKAAEKRRPDCCLGKPYLNTGQHFKKRTPK